MPRRPPNGGDGGGSSTFPQQGITIAGDIEWVAGTDIAFDLYPEQARVVVRSTAAGGGSHAATHQDAGTDEVSVAGLSGVLADPQTPAAHAHVEGDVSLSGPGVVVGRNTAGAGGAEEIAAAHSLQIDATGLRLDGDADAPGANKVYGTDGAGVKGWKADPAGGATREELVAHWTDPRTKTNVGTAFVDVYSGTNESGFELDVDFAGKTQVKAVVCWNKVGAGTQTVQAVQADLTSNVLFTLDVVSGRNVFALAALPAWATGIQRIKLQAKSTTGTDDPIFGACALYLK